MNSAVVNNSFLGDFLINILLEKEISLVFFSFLLFRLENIVFGLSLSFSLDNFILSLINELFLCKEFKEEKNL